MTKLWESKAKTAAITGGVVKCTKIYTPTERVLELFEELRRTGQATGDLLLDWKKIERQHREVLKDYAEFLLVQDAIAQRAAAAGDQQGKPPLGNTPLSTLKSMFKQTAEKPNTPVARKRRSVRVTPEQCQAKMGAPGLSECDGANIERDVIARRDLELVLKALGWTPRQIEMAKLRAQGLSRQEIATQLKTTVKQLEPDFRAISSDRRGKLLRQRMRAYSTLSPQRLPTATDARLAALEFANEPESSN